jgi:hypothetical protein
LAVALEIPIVDAATSRLPPIDAAMLQEICRRLGATMPGDIFRRSHRNLPQVRPERHGDHVVFQELAKADADVETRLNDIGDGVVDGEIERDLRIGLVEAAERRLDVPYRQRCRVSVSPIGQSTACDLSSKRVGSFRCSRTIRHPFQDGTSTIPVSAIYRRRCECWWIFCGGRRANGDEVSPSLKSREGLAYQK